MRTWLLTLLALVVAAPLRAETIREHFLTDASFQLYVVILSVKQNADGSVRSVQLSKVIEPRSGSTEPVKVDVPEKFMVSVEKLIRARKYELDSTSKDGLILPFATYYYYAPALGPEPITDLDAPMP
jgi:hypothetical protein